MNGANQVGNHAQKAAMSERFLLRVGAVSAVLGAVLAIIGNVLHPRTPASGLGDPEAFLRLVAGSPIWVTAHVGLILGSLFFLGGLVALAHSLSAEGDSGLARLGLAGALVGSAMNFIVLALDGIAMKDAAESWINASGAEKDAALRAGAILYYLDFALFDVWVMIFFGMTFILYGLAVSASNAYPRWLGWIAVVGGVGAALVGLVQAYIGTSQATFLILFPAFAALLSIWLLVMGVLLWRRASI
jgi:Domain of unknown function (DUF4386)